jgi:tripartite-type tricarboxylate transporter receptor subunit TctC
MKFLRRQFLQATAGTAVLAALMGMSWAQNYPLQPARIIVGAAAGSSPDIFARLMGKWLSDRLGQQFIIENRPGAAGNIGTDVVVHSPSDGYTILLVAAANAINATLYEKLNFNFIRDIVPVASIVRTPHVMVINPSVPVKTVSEFIAYAKANPGKLNFGSAGNGSSIHMAGELFKIMTGVNMVHVPYRGGAPAITDLLGGQIQVVFDTTPNSMAHINAGRLRALAVTTTTRSEALPDIPTVGESVPDYEVSSWWGIGVPKGTPVEIVDKLNVAINAGLADREITARLAELGGEPLAGSPSDFGKLIAEETKKWAKVVKFSGAKPD